MNRAFQDAAELDRLAAEREALADALVCDAMDELGPTEADRQRRIAAGYRELAAAVRTPMNLRKRVG